jgi:hypothetical protein
LTTDELRSWLTFIPGDSATVPPVDEVGIITDIIIDNNLKIFYGVQFKRHRIHVELEMLQKCES